MGDMCTLLYNFPPELRNEVYKYLSTPDVELAPTKTGIPLQLKKFDCRHTSIQICPVHYGSTRLLALQESHFQEAREYGSWLLDNAIELHIGVVFKGRVNTFVQADWDKRVEMHLRKLAKQHPWLKKVAKYDIRILWDATDGILRSKKKNRTTGRLPREMAKTLTLLMDDDLRKKRADVHVRLLLEHRVALESALSSTKFALGDFLATEDDEKPYKNLTKEIRKRPFITPTQPLVRLPFVPARPVAQVEKNLLVAEHGVVLWTDWAEGHLAVKNIATIGHTSYLSVGNVEYEDGAGADYVLKRVMEECLGR